MSFNPGQFWRSRDYKTSARLYLQHWLFQETLGFVVEPTILDNLQKERPEGDLRVADLGCGNAAWLVEAAKVLPKSKLYGFDIQPAHFPAKSFLPDNVDLTEANVLTGQIPEKWLGTFDIVHIRAFASIIKNNDTSPILKVVTSLLRPGGYVQWEESNVSAMTAIPPTSEVQAQSCQILLQIIKQGGKANGTLDDWYGELEKHLSAGGLKDSAVKRAALKEEHYKAWTDNYLLVYEEVAELLPSEKDVPDAPLSKEKYLGIFEGVLKETSKGVALHTQHILVGIGRKPGE